jgi:photosystem II stability/assembly factor-like uncharacterized protein
LAFHDTQESLMVETRDLATRDGDVLLLIGTLKGAFLARSSPSRSSWEIGGPYFPGHGVYATAYDGRAGRRRLWAAASSMHWGSTLHYSDDAGRSWSDPEIAPVKFPEGTSLSLKQIWQIRPGRTNEPDVLYCGVEPAALFESRDAGTTWSLVQGLHDHPHRPKWQPGGGGLCLHTIVPHPTDKHRLLVAISTGGVYRTDDGGRTWSARNVGVRAEYLPDKHPEFGQCVHKVVRHPSRPDRLFLQNHWGLYRSVDGGDSWQDIANGVPSDFGFAMEMHPHDPDTVYIVPMESDAFRVPPGAQLRVWQTRDAGASWQPLFRGLPQEGAYEVVLRDALAADELDPAGLYFGTRSGKLFGSRNGGRTWETIADALPAITCIKAAVLGGGVAPRARRDVPRAMATRGRRSKGEKRGARDKGKGKGAQRVRRRPAARRSL